MNSRFSNIQIWLHWLAFILIIIVYSLIEAKDFIPKTSPTHDFIKVLHFNFGILVWLVMLLRLGIRHLYPDPEIIPAPPRWQMKIAKLMEYTLYIVFLTLPILGILTLAYGGKQWLFLGANIPVFVTPDLDIKSLIEDIHETLANIAYFLIATHAAAALFHHYIQRDNTLRRML